MKAKPCPKCGSKDLNIGDCGYSSFNIAWVRCNGCQLVVKVTGDSAVSTWNQWVKDPIDMLLKRIRGTAKDRRRAAHRLDKKDVDVTEYAADLISDLIADKGET